MGNTSSSHSSNTINAAPKTPKTPLLLLLGVGHAGKSTLFKSLGSINCPWELGRDIDLWLTLIRQLSGICNCLKLQDSGFLSLSDDKFRVVATQLCRFPERTKSLIIPYDPSKDANVIKFWPEATREDWVTYADANQCFDVEIYKEKVAQYTITIDIIIALSQEPAIMSLSPYDCMEQLETMNESTAYWWPQRGEEFFVQKKYDVTPEDALRCRVRTKGFVENNIYLPCPDIKSNLSICEKMIDSDTINMVKQWNCDENFVCRVMDTGEESWERKKWIHHFDGVDIMMYVVSLSDYHFRGNAVLNELRGSGNSNGYFDDSLKTFGELVGSRRFASRRFPATKFIICFNKYQHFSQKLSERPFNQYFPDYHGDNDDPEMIVEWIKEQYLNEYDKIGLDREKHKVEFILIDPLDLENVGQLIHTVKSHIDVIRSRADS